jgi:hypothetical protein
MDTGGGGGSYPEGIDAGCEADHLPPSNAVVMNAWSYTFTLPVCLHVEVLN